jgi:hypothetical protein
VLVDHTCWIDASGAIAGCRFADGTIQGFSTGQETICYFLEPMPTGDTEFRCKD